MLLFLYLLYFLVCIISILHIRFSHVNLESDYRQVGDMCLDCNKTFTRGQGPNEIMHGYPHLRNIDGLWLNWTTEFYNYSARPSCPDNCNGKYLYCNTTFPETLFPRGVCVTKTRTDCIKNNRNGRYIKWRSMLNVTKRFAFDVLKGDGRNRRMSKKQAWDNLIKFIQRTGSIITI